MASSPCPSIPSQPSSGSSANVNNARSSEAIMPSSTSPSKSTRRPRSRGRTARSALAEPCGSAAGSGSRTTRPIVPKPPGVSYIDLARPPLRSNPDDRTCPVAVLAQYRGGGRSQISDAPPSPQSSNLRVGSQLPFHIVTAGPEDDASGAAGLELGETFAQLLASACEGHLFGGGYVDERVMAVRNVEGMTAVNGEVADVFVRPHVRR